MVRFAGLAGVLLVGVLLYGGGFGKPDGITFQSTTSGLQPLTPGLESPSPGPQAPASTPRPSVDFPNEPDGFEVVVEEEWLSFDPVGWWHTPTNMGTTEIVDGRLVWTYPQGKPGGSVPGAKVALDSRRHGPYQYHRDEGVTLSENFHGHRSSVNKFRFFTDASGRPHSYVGFFGSDDGPLTIGINGRWAGPHYDTRMRWNSEANLAAPTRREATFVRGVPHTVETLFYTGTLGNTDGWVKLWLDGALILHYEDIGGVVEGNGPTIKAIHFAPVWGGTQDEVPATQTLTVDYSYVSTGG